MSKCEFLEGLKEEDQCKETAIVKTIDDRLLCKECALIDLEQYLNDFESTGTYSLEKIDD